LELTSARCGLSNNSCKQSVCFNTPQRFREPNRTFVTKTTLRLGFAERCISDQQTSLSGLLSTIIRGGSELIKKVQIHPKTLIEIVMVLLTNSGSFPSNSHVSANFSILLRFGEFWNPKKSLCNRLQFRTLFLPHRFIKMRPSHQRPVSIESLEICRCCFARCRTVLGVAKGFFWHVVKLEKR